MTDFQRKLAVILLSHGIAYVGAQLLMLVVDPLAFVPEGRVFVTPLGLAVAFPAVWFGWRTITAVGDVCDTCSDLYVVLVARRERRRHARLLDNYGTGLPAVNRAA